MSQKMKSKIEQVSFASNKSKKELKEEYIKNSQKSKARKTCFKIGRNNFRVLQHSGVTLACNNLLHISK
jgi:mRNA-degrading endonuclease HigB of HigAB toxin-antitoxin module